jgi:hypothetical protein
MANITWSQLIGIGATFQPLNGWQYEYAPFGGNLEIVHDAAAVGVVATITSGSDTLQERSPVSSGGAIGVMPSALDRLPVVDEVAAGDRMKILYENTTGAAVNVQGTAIYTPG